MAKPRKWTDEQFAEMAKRFDGANLNMSKFCKQNHYDYSTFYQYYKKLKVKTAVPA